MKIQLVSDLHLEFYNHKYIDDLEKMIPKDDSDVLVLAGDIIKFRPTWEMEDIFDYCSENFDHTIFIPGNHEYYRASVRFEYKKEYHHIRDNVYLLNNECIEIDGINFICTTLWTTIRAENVSYVWDGMNDYRVIKEAKTYKPIRPSDVSYFNSKAVPFIFSSIDKSKKNIVVTHHLPSYKCINEEYRGSYINDGFANYHLDDSIIESDIDYWIYGHTHKDPGDVDLGGTILTCNPFGYPGETRTIFKKKNIIIE